MELKNILGSGNMAKFRSLFFETIHQMSLRILTLFPMMKM